MSNSISDAVAAWLQSFGPLPPFAVPIPDARKVLGNKSRSELYAAAGRGDVDFIKDNGKTLVTTASLVRYCSQMQPAKIKAPLPKKSWPVQIKSTPPRRRRAQTAQSTNVQT